MLGPHIHTPAPTARGWRTPTARPVGKQLGEGQRLTPDAPHNGGRHLPRGRPSATPTASNAGPQGRTLWGRCWVPTPAPTAPGTHGTRNPGCPLQRTGGGGGTAPDSRRPSKRWQATPPGDAPPLTPRHAPPTGHAGQGDSVGPPHPHTRTHSTWVADPNSPPSGRAVGGGTAPDPRRPSQWWKAPPPGMPFHHSHSEQRRPARAHAVGPVLGPHARTDRTRDTRDAEPWLPAPEDGRPREGQRLTPGAPRNGGRPPPPGTAPHHPRGMQPPQDMQAEGTVLGPHTHTPAPTARGWPTPTARPAGGQSGEGRRLASDSPRNGGRQPPRRRPPATPTASNARAHAVGPVLGPQTRTDRTRDTRVAEPWLPAPEDGQSREGQRLTSDAPHHGGRRPPSGTLFRHPHSEKRRPARAHAVGPVLGPHARTDRARDTWVTEPWLPAPEDGRPGEGQRLTPDAPRNAGKRPPRGRPSATPTKSNAPTHQRTSHGTSAPQPLLLGTATQQWRNPRPHAKHAPGLGRWTKLTRSSGRWDSETAKETPHKGTRARTATWRQYLSPPREARPRNPRRRRAACPRSAPRGNGATAPAKAGAPNSTPSPAPMTERCPRWNPRPHAPPYATGWRRAGSWMRPRAEA